DPPGRDQHAAIRSRAPEDGTAAAAGASDLPTGAVRRSSRPLLRAPDPRAPARLGRPESALGPEALAACRRPGPAPQRLEGPAHAGAQAAGLPGQPLRADAGGC